MGQLQLSQGHQKTNKLLIGIFSDKYNYSLIPVIQFISHCDYFREIIQNVKISEKNHENNNNMNIRTIIIKQLKQIFNNIEMAKLKAIRIQKFFNNFLKIYPSLIGYKRKNPSDVLFLLLNLLHQHLNYYKVTNVIQNFGKDQWDLFYNKQNKIQSHSPIYDALTSVLSTNYKCNNIKCNHQIQIDNPINCLKFQFPKNKRKAKVVQQQLQEKGYESPRKRGKSLISFLLPQEQLPLTLPQFFIQFLKQNLHEQIYCPQCKNDQIPMKKLKMRFKKLAQILIIQFNRFSNVTDQIIYTQVQMQFNKINLTPFCCEDKNLTNNKKIAQNKQSIFNQKDKQNQQGQQIKYNEYQLCTAIGIQNGTFPVVCKSKSNNQIYILKHQIVQMLGKNKFNPYIVCLKRTQNKKCKQFYDEIVQYNNKIKQQKSINKPNTQRKQAYILPQFYLTQIKHGIQLPLYQALSCKHNKLKPFIQKKCQQQTIVSQKLYEQLIQNYKGNIYQNKTCQQCISQIQILTLRKTKQKQLIKQYDKFKTVSNVMISLNWLKKWTNYLYSSENNEKISYFHKGYPFPPPIDNKILLENNKCKQDLIKNKDFKVINIFIFKLLKELYGGGPQIRYKWKSQLSAIDQMKIKEIKLKGMELKQLYSLNIGEIESPKKTSIVIQKSSSFMDTVYESQIEEQTTQAVNQN